MLDTIKETKEVASNTSGSRNFEIKINPYLSLGWVIVGTWVTDYGDPSMKMETLHVLLGWPKNEPTAHPEEERLDWVQPRMLNQGGDNDRSTLALEDSNNAN